MSQSAASIFQHSMVAQRTGAALVDLDAPESLSMSNRLCTARSGRVAATLPESSIPAIGRLTACIFVNPEFRTPSAFLLR